MPGLGNGAGNTLARSVAAPDRQKRRRDTSPDHVAERIEDAAADFFAHCAGVRRARNEDAGDLSATIDMRTADGKEMWRVHGSLCRILRCANLMDRLGRGTIVGVEFGQRGHQGRASMRSQALPASRNKNRTNEDY